MKKFIVFLALIFCGIARVQSQSMHDTVSRGDKLYALSMIWKEADYNFVFFDRQPQLNWDSLYRTYIPKILAAKNVLEYFRVLSSFTGLLKDGHTSVMFQQFYWDQIDSPPIKTVVYQGKRYVTAVEASLKDSIPIGSEILTFNGQSWADFSAGDGWYYFKNTPLTLSIVSPANKRTSAKVLRNWNVLFRAHTLKWYPAQAQPAYFDFKYQSLSPKIAYVAINTFGDSAMVDSFKKVLPLLRQHQTLIFDIRKNSGGNDDYALQIARYLTDKPYMLGPQWRTRTSNAAKRAWESADKVLRKKDVVTPYLSRNSWEIHPSDTISIAATLKRLNMPVYVLTSANTASAAEDFLIYLLGSKNVTRLGQTTAGTSGQPEFFDIPKGFQVRICAKRDALPDGSDYINTGIKPDVPVEPFVSLKGEIKDLELEKAMELIKSGAVKSK
jgi:C-terminal processing protease CtpA/Prc